MSTDKVAESPDEQALRIQDKLIRQCYDPYGSTFATEFARRLRAEQGKGQEPASREQNQIFLIRVTLGLNPAHDPVECIRVLYEEGKNAFENLRGEPCTYAHEWKPAPVAQAPVAQDVASDATPETDAHYKNNRDPDTAYHRLFHFARHLERQRNALRAKLAQDGMVMVPREPTPEMIQAGGEWFMACRSDSSTTEWQDAQNIYRAMLSASPSPTTPDQDAVDAKMLDWLEANRTWTTRYEIKQGVIRWAMRDNGEPWGQWHSTMRDAIQAAMSKEPK